MLQASHPYLDGFHDVLPETPRSISQASSVLSQNYDVLFDLVSPRHCEERSDVAIS